MISLPAGPSRKRTRDTSPFRPISPLPHRHTRSTRQSQRRNPPIAEVNQQLNFPHDTQSLSSTQQLHVPIDDNDEEIQDDEDYDENFLADLTDSETDSDDEPELTQEQSQRASKGKAKQIKAKKSKLKPVPDNQQLDKLTTDAGRLSKENYHLISTNWTDRYIDQLLAHRKEIVHSRPPSDVLAEAEVHQARYRRTKKLLSLLGHCSYTALESAL